MGGKFFSSYRKAFELAQSFQDSQKSDLNCSYDALVKKEALSSALGRFKQMCYRLSWNSFCPKDRASSCKSHHILWLNINGFLACKINHFAQNKFKVKNAQVNSKNQLNFQGLKKKDRSNGCISIYYTFKNNCPNFYTHKNCWITQKK